jgi:hypothetical protein
MNQETSEPRKKWLLENIYFISLYFIVTGSLYLWGYWPNFGIDLLEYIAITDIIKITAYPISISAIAVGATVIIANAFVKKTITENRLLNPQHSDVPPTDQDKISKRLEAIAWITAPLAVIIMIALALINKTFILTIPILIATPLAYWAVGGSYLSDQIPNGAIRKTVTFFIVFLPFLSYSYGAGRAEDILSGQRFYYVISGFENYPKNQQANESLRYIGRAGEHIFLYNSANRSTIISKVSEDSVLEIKYHESSPRIIKKFLLNLKHQLGVY